MDDVPADVDHRVDVDGPALVPAGVDRPEEREALRIGALDAAQEALVGACAPVAEYTPPASQCQISTAAPLIGLQLDALTTVRRRVSGDTGRPFGDVAAHGRVVDVVRALRLLGREDAG